jgi:hypothetical protein
MMAISCPWGVVRWVAWWQLYVGSVPMARELIFMPVFTDILFLSEQGLN